MKLEEILEAQKKEPWKSIPVCPNCDLHGSQPNKQPERNKHPCYVCSRSLWPRYPSFKSKRT